MVHVVSPVSWDPIDEKLVISLPCVKTSNGCNVSLHEESPSPHPSASFDIPLSNLSLPPKNPQIAYPKPLFTQILKSPIKNHKSPSTTLDSPIPRQPSPWVVLHNNSYTNHFFLLGRRKKTVKHKYNTE